MKKAIQVILTILLFIHEAHAETGLLRAKVTTAEGAFLVNARIVLTGPDSKPLNQIRTGPTGEFAVQIPLGEYQIEVNGGGFGALSRIIRIVPGTNFVSLVVESYPGRFGRRNNALQSKNNLSAIVLDEDILRTNFSDDPHQLDRVFAVQSSRANLVGGADFIVDGEPARLPAKDQIRQSWIESDPYSAEYSKPGFARVDLISPVEREAFHGAATFSFRDEGMNSTYLTSNGTGARPAYQSRYLHGVLNGPIVAGKLFTSVSLERHGEDHGGTLVQALTPTGLISQHVETGQADQVFNNRLQYEISPRNTLNFNARYQTLRVPNLLVGGITLPERGVDERQRGWDAQVRETSYLTASLANELRFQFRRDKAVVNPIREGAAIDVAGAFSGGGSSEHSDFRNTTYQFEDLLSRSGPRFNLRTGIQGRLIQDYSSYSNDARGVFNFDTLLDYVGGRPSSYLQLNGGARSAADQTETAAFVQSDWNVTPNLALSTGVRYELQTHLRDYNNVDPRIGFAFAIRPSLVVRGGAGSFHERLSSAQVAVFRQQDGLPHQTVFFLANPSYPDPFVSGTLVPMTPSSTLAVGTASLVAPYVVNGGLSIEKWFASGLIVSLSGDFIRGVHQLRASWSGDAISRTVEYESAGNAFARNLIFRFRTPNFLSGRVSMKFMGDYTLGRSEDDAVALTDGADWRGRWDDTLNYPKHHLWTGGTLSFPSHISTGLWLTAHSAVPYALTTNGSQYSPKYVSLDASLSKIFTLPLEMSSAGTTLTVFLYGQNVLNRRNFTSVYPDIASPLFIPPAGTGDIRQLEAGVRLRF